MKLMLGGTPVKKMMIHNDTMDATMVASDLQAGVTAYANGQKVTGTGKSFEFAQYGSIETNELGFVPTLINVVEIASTDYPIKSFIGFDKMIGTDFSTSKVIGNVIIDNIEYPITININGNLLSFNCEKTILLEFFYGRDNYA